MTRAAPLDETPPPVPSSHRVDFRPPPLPDRAPIEGTWCRLEPLDPARHGADLAPLVLAGDPTTAESWRYLPYGPFADRTAYEVHLAGQAASDDPLFFAVIDHDAGGRARGVLSFMRIEPEQGCIEIGNIWFPPALQRRRAASEAVMRAVEAAILAGYRRVEWKCDAANAPSRRAAERFGFRFEGVFRRHRVVKGRNRDTAWFSIVEEEAPARLAAYRRWLDPANFDADGRQRGSLTRPDPVAGVANS